MTDQEQINDKQTPDPNGRAIIVIAAITIIPFVVLMARLLLMNSGG